MDITLQQVLDKIKTPHGTWRPTGGASEWSGTCQKCGTVGPAVNLELKRLPFGRGEVWVCKGGCE